METRLVWPFILLQVATVVAIVLFLRMLLHKQLQIGLKRIQKLDQKNLKKEIELNEKLQQLDKEYTAKIEEAARRAQSMIDTAKEEIKKMRETERIKAKDEAKRTIASALQQKEKLLKEVEREVFNKGIEFSVLILKRVFSEDELKDLRSKVSKEVIDYLVGSKQVDDLLKKNRKLEIVTRDPLANEDRKYILKIIEGKVSGKVDAKFSVDKDVMGGLVLKIDKQIIDGSIAYRINKAALELREEIK